MSQLANLHPTAGTLAAYAYGYDIDPQTQQPTLLGQRTSLAMTIPSQGLTAAASTYLYDPDYQLTQANYPTPAPYNGEVHAWTYDAIGNRLTNTVNGVPQTYTYFKNGSNPLNGQRLQSDSVNAYTYTANGNTLTRNGSGGNFTFGWDYDDRMTSISGAATASYTYDYQGRRTSKTVGGVTTSCLYDGLNLIRASGSSTGDYLFGPGIDEPLAMVRGSSAYYYAVDGLGSVNLLTDTTGTVQDAYLYDAWGVTRSQTGTLANDFGYTAREFGEAGLSFYRARYYQAGVGRFVSEDKAGHAEGHPVFYMFPGNGPMLFSDPFGLFRYKLDGKVKPVKPDAAMRIDCLEWCLDRELVVTGGGEAEEHNWGSCHADGAAADFGFNSNTGLGGMERQFFCCAKRCGFNYGAHEFKGTSKEHFHVQIPNGLGGAHGEIKPECQQECK